VSLQDTLAEAYRRHMAGGGLTDEDVTELAAQLNASEAATRMAELTTSVRQRDHISRVQHAFLSRAIPLL
jgi:hypothetical protein